MQFHWKTDCFTHSFLRWREVAESVSSVPLYRALSSKVSARDELGEGDRWLLRPSRRSNIFSTFFLALVLKCRNELSICDTETSRINFICVLSLQFSNNIQIQYCYCERGREFPGNFLPKEKIPHKSENSPNVFAVPSTTAVEADVFSSPLLAIHLRRSHPGCCPCQKRTRGRRVWEGLCCGKTALDLLALVSLEWDWFRNPCLKNRDDSKINYFEQTFFRV